jgi:hypothetical protein
MNLPGIAPGLIPTRPGLEREEPELAFEDDIPPDGGSAMPPDESPAGGPAAPSPGPPPHVPKPADPEPLQDPIDPEKGRVKVPEPGKSEHPTK